MTDKRIGLIGYSKHAKANLLPTLKLLGQKVVAIATQRKETAELAKNEWHIEKGYSNYKEMLEKEQLDGVIIATPPQFQYELTKDCLSANVNVFVEKYLGCNQDEARNIHQLSDSIGKFVMVGFMKRFSPVFQKLKRVITYEKFGKILSINQTYAVRSFGVDSNNFILLATIHNVDLLRYFGGEVKDLKGTYKMTDGQLIQNFLCTMDSGVLASTTFMATPAWEKRLEQIMITGTNGYAILETGNILKYHYTGPKLDIPRWQVNEEEEVVVGTMLTSTAGGAKDLYQNGFVGEITEFLNCLSTGRSPIQNNSLENLKTMELCDKIFAEMKEVK